MPTWGEILKELADLNDHPEKIPSPGWSAFDYLRRKYLAEMQTLTKRHVVLYATAWTRTGNNLDPAALMVMPEDIQGFMEVFHGRTGDALDLILHSPGGSAEATAAIVSYARSMFKDVRVFVPHAAMSAATMLACSANKIVMGNHSFLGPIDPQFVLQTELGMKSVPAHAILEQFKLAQQECQIQAKIPSWLPILRQYGPALIVQCEYAQELSKELVSEWLEKYMFAGDKAAKAKAADISAKLANHQTFKSHGRFISREEAGNLGLNVETLEKDQKLQDAVLSVFHATMHTFNASGANKIFENHLGKAFVKQSQQRVIQQPMMIPIQPPPIPIQPPPVQIKRPGPAAPAAPAPTPKAPPEAPPAAAPAVS